MADHIKSKSSHKSGHKSNGTPVTKVATRLPLHKRIATGGRP